MNSNTSDDYLIDFYGPGRYWFAITVGIIALFIILSNALFIIITTTSKSLRIKSSNWILIGFALSDLLHGSAHVFDAFAILYGSVDNRQLCSLAGAFVLLTAGSSLGFPSLIAADRHYKIKLQENRKFSLGTTLFTDRFIIPLIIGWYCLSVTLSAPLLRYNAFGEDPDGFCGAKKFTELRLLFMYQIMLVVFFGSLIISIIFYLRLDKWLKLNQHSANVEAMRYTREIMMVTKIITLIPMFVAGPAVVLSTFQMVLSEMPMWLKRALTVPYFLSTVANPWMTICLVRPFRRRVVQLLRKAKRAIPAETTARVITVEVNSNRRKWFSIKPKAAVTNR